MPITVLPMELLGEVFKNLSIQNAEACRDSAKGTSWASIVQGALDIRLNPVGILGETFSNPVQLLAAMGDTGTILSGSQALNYFVPDSASPESDYDFFAPSTYSSILKMIKALEMGGVKWESVIQKMIDVVTTPRSTSPVPDDVHVTAFYMERLYWFIRRDVYNPRSPDDQDNDWTTKLARKYSDSLRALELVCFAFLGNTPWTWSHRNWTDDQWVYSGPSGARIVVNTSITYGDLRFGVVMRGSVDCGNRCRKVQMMIPRIEDAPSSTIGSPLNTVLKFYSSHVMAVLSGFMAAHLYYTDAIEKKGALWPLNSVCSTTHVEKWSKRGYALAYRGRDSMACPRIRSMADADAKIVSFSDYVTHPELNPRIDAARIPAARKKIKAHLKRIHSLSWIESYGHTSSIIDPIAEAHKASNRLQITEQDQLTKAARTGNTSANVSKRKQCRDILTRDERALAAPYSAFLGQTDVSAWWRETTAERWPMDGQASGSNRKVLSSMLFEAGVAHADRDDGRFARVAGDVQASTI
ncbi:hypothetical protein H2199_008981 [Coniosporium tulheliwenetii]|uniref:Uncharacterized protein n=1 Tax=Coniosporium tulheliwenetii TaxID=3383036 RepID=A0ACC2YGV0_9PEZI|nr:hypothetical protein H2199_008981 [Cladosporium sp. JES 115]